MFKPRLLIASTLCAVAFCSHARSQDAPARDVLPTGTPTAPAPVQTPTAAPVVEAPALPLYEYQPLTTVTHSAVGIPATVYSSSYVSPGYTSVAVPPPGGPVMAPYSYYAAAPMPARYYVGYGVGDFPFHGQPYGHPNDRWTWSYMSGESRVSNYYYPPVR